MSGIKDVLSKIGQESTETGAPKHREQGVEQKAPAGSYIKKAQAPSHVEKELSKRPGQVVSGHALPTVPSKKTPTTPVKSPRDRAAIETLYQEAQNELYAKNIEKAELLYIEAAEAGHVKSALFLAHTYKSGVHFGINLEKAFHYAQRAADSGDPMGLETLANYYKDGIGVARDYAKARDYYNQAVEAGRSVKQIIFDELECVGLTDYQKGEHFEHLAEEKIKAVSKETEYYLTKAYLFYEAAIGLAPGAKEKAADMMFKMGELYEKGLGGHWVDLKTSLFVFQDALKEGSPLAMEKFSDIERLLGEVYASGVTSPKALDQPLVSYIKENAATFDDAILLLYGKNAGLYFEVKGDFLKAAACYFMEDQDRYNRMIVQLQLAKQSLSQPKVSSVQKPPPDYKTYFMIDQSSLTSQFLDFLNQLAKLSPNSYNQTEIDRIGAEMNRGQCNGFSLYYAMLALSTDKEKLQDKTEKYAILMEEICDWTRSLFEPPSGFSYDKFRTGDKQGLTEDEIERLAFTDKVKTLMQMIRYGQQKFSDIKEMNKDAKEGEMLKLDQVDIQLLLGDEFMSQIHINKNFVPVREALHNLIPMMEVSLNQTNVALLGYSGAFLKHIVSITFREDQYFFFDSNHWGGAEADYDLRYSAIACETLDQVIDLIEKKYEIDDQLKGQIELQVIERTDVKG